MSYNAEDSFPQVDQFFAPCLYNAGELAAITKCIGEHPASAREMLADETFGIERHGFRDVHGKNMQVVESAEDQYQAAVYAARERVLIAITRFQELDDQQEHGQQKWIGRAAVKVAVDQWEERQRRYLDAKRRNGGRGHHPELTVVEHGRRKYQGNGSDVGRPRKFDLRLFDEGYFEQEDFTADLAGGNGKPSTPLVADAPAVPVELIVGDDYFQCPLDNHRESFKPESDNSINLAKARMRKYMQDRNEPDYDEAVRAIWSS